MKRIIKRIVMTICIVAMLGASGQFEAFAAEEKTLATRDANAIANTDDREDAFEILVDHINMLKATYQLSAAAQKRLDNVFYEASVYIANTTMSVGQLRSYVDETKENLSKAIGDAAMISKTSGFLYLANTTGVPSGKYGEHVTVTLSVINLGKENISDVVITPTVSNDPKVWPFVIGTSSDVRMISNLQCGNDVTNATLLKRDLIWDFVVSNDVCTGTYPLTFHARYYRNGNVEETDLVTYVDIIGKSSNGKLVEKEKDEDSKVSTPRIIVTGYSTSPEKVYAGDEYDLVITVQNTSKSTTVSNIQFDLKASVEEADGKSSYEAFLPTSGASSIFVDKIAPGESTDLNIKMTTRADLAQKPYAITLSAKYEDWQNNPYEASTNISIPVYQEQRIDTGDVTVTPEMICVGESTNICFDIYNKGKVILYNVQVSFEGGELSEGNAFVGKIEPGGTGSVDVMATGVSEVYDGPVIATITYEDDAGNVNTITKDINLTISPMMEYDEMDFEEMMPEEEAKPVPWGMILGIVGGIVVVAIITVIIIKHRAKKKMLKHMYDEDDD